MVSNPLLNLSFALKNMEIEIFGFWLQDFTIILFQKGFGSFGTATFGMMA